MIESREKRVVVWGTVASGACELADHLRSLKAPGVEVEHVAAIQRPEGVLLGENESPAKVIFLYPQLREYSKVGGCSIDTPRIVAAGLEELCRKAGSTLVRFPRSTGNTPERLLFAENVFRQRVSPQI